MKRPVAVVRIPEEEQLWGAKEIVQGRYPEAEGVRFRRIVMRIYKKMAHYDSGAPRTTKLSGVAQSALSVTADT